MEEVAVITDIHANLPALQATLARIDELGIERVYCGGDLGYGPHPNEVVARIAERGIPPSTATTTTRSPETSRAAAAPTSISTTANSASSRSNWTLAHTDRRAKDWMLELPFDVHIDVGPTSVHLVHCSPRKVNEYLFEDKPARLYERLAAAEDSDVLVFGHTHKPWVREHVGVLFVTAAWSESPKDGDPRGAFALLSESTDGVDVSIERVAYDAEAVAAEVRHAGLPGEYADKLLTAA